MPRTCLARCEFFVFSTTAKKHFVSHVLGFIRNIRWSACSLLHRVTKIIEILEVSCVDCDGACGFKKEASDCFRCDEIKGNPNRDLIETGSDMVPKLLKLLTYPLEGNLVCQNWSKSLGGVTSLIWETPKIWLWWCMLNCVWSFEIFNDFVRNTPIDGLTTFGGHRCNMKGFMKY